MKNAKKLPTKRPRKMRTVFVDLTERQVAKLTKLCKLHNLPFPDGLSFLLEKVVEPTVGNDSSFEGQQVR